MATVLSVIAARAGSRWPGRRPRIRGPDPVSHTPQHRGCDQSVGYTILRRDYTVEASYLSRSWVSSPGGLSLVLVVLEFFFCLPFWMSFWDRCIPFRGFARKRSIRALRSNSCSMSVIAGPSCFCERTNGVRHNRGHVLISSETIKHCNSVLSHNLGVTSLTFS
jgi:hypothetical protein